MKMAQQKGSPVSRESASSQREGEAKTSEEGVEDECDQNRRVLYALGRKRAQLQRKELELKEIMLKKNKLEVRRNKLEMSKPNLEKRGRIGELKGRERKLKEQERKLEGQERKLEEQLSPLRLEVEQRQQSLLPKRMRLEDICNELEVENAQRLDKLPQEMWEKIFDNLEENDLFPLALSCRYFRQKQKELLARWLKRRKKGEPRPRFRTYLPSWRLSQRLSAEYLRFCRKEKGQNGSKAARIRYLAALHGHLPLLQELKPSKKLVPYITEAAAHGGQLETLQWLKTQEGFELDEDIFAMACKGGQLEVLKWLRSEGCPWDRTCWDYASSSLIREWLVENGCPVYDPYDDVYSEYDSEDGEYW